MVFGSLFRSTPKAGGKILVAFASQTGAAERIAWLSANALASSGSFVRVAALGGLTAGDLAEAGTLLVVTSTYGAGEAPDSARAFARKQIAQTPALKGLRYAVLALGDRKYDANFCGFGRGVDRWLAAGRATRLFDVICVNGDDDDAAMTKWCEQLTKLGADTSVEQLMPGAPQDWILAERRLLNPGSPGGEAWAIALTPRNLAHLNWTAGDIAEIWPRNSEAAVDKFLAEHGLDGTLSFKWRGHLTFLRDIIAHSRLPRPHEVEGISLQWLVGRLESYGAREYSIASPPDNGQMELLVRKAVKDDGSLGLGSGWLTQTAEVGGVIKLRLRPNPNFQPPPAKANGESADPNWCGHRLRGPARASALPPEEEAGRGLAVIWRTRARQRFLLWQSNCGMAGRRHTHTHRPGLFARPKARKSMSSIWWPSCATRSGAFVERGASILVCGGLDMAAGVQDVLVSILGEEKLEQMTQDGLYRRDIY